MLEQLHARAAKFAIHRGAAGIRWWLQRGPFVRTRQHVFAAVYPGFLARPHVDFVAPTVFGSIVSGNTRDIIPALIWWTGGIEWNLSYFVQERLRPGDTFVDVGAHVGYFTLLASRCVGPAGRVVSIEASPSTHRRLLDNLKLNDHAKNVRTINAAAGFLEGTAPFFQAGDDSTGVSSLRQRRGAAFEADVRIAPLSVLLEPEELSSARMFKIDVEGAEFDTVRGLLNAVDALREDVEIVVETSRDWHFDGRPGTVRDLVDIFSGHGFSAYAMPKDHLPDPRTYRRPTRWSPAIDDGHFDVVFSRSACAAL